MKKDVRGPGWQMPMKLLAHQKEYIRNLWRHVPNKTKELLFPLVLAVVAGSLVVLFMKLTNLLYQETFGRLAHLGFLKFAVGSLIVIVSSSLIVGIMQYLFAPTTSGSGIPQLKIAYWKEIGYVPLKATIVKFLGGIISLGGGASLGREGPSIFLAGGIASALSRFFGVDRRQRRGAVAIGAAAGLAAAFNTPIAAITFVLEELISDWNSRYLGKVVLASVAGALVVFGLVGRHPAFSVPSLNNISWVHYLVVPFVAVVAGTVGALFFKWTITWRGWLKENFTLPLWLLPLLGGLITWVLGITVFALCGKTGIFGLGYHDLSAALSGGEAWQIALLLVFFKLIATTAGYATAGNGGIFSPMLFLGGFSGLFVSNLVGHWIPLTPADHIVLTIVGMSACLGAVIRAPLTSILIVFEMTHEFNVVPGLMVGTLISQLISHKVSHHNFYEDLLFQDGHELVHIKPPTDLRSWQNQPLSSLATTQPAAIRQLEKEAVVQTLKKYPYQFFPVLVEGQEPKLVERKELKIFVETDRQPTLNPAPICLPDETLHEASRRFIESPIGMVLIMDAEHKELFGLITLHDLLRAQAAAQE